MNNIEFRWLLTGADKSEKKLQYRQYVNQQYMELHTSVTEPTIYTVKKWSDWLDIPVVVSNGEINDNA